MPIITKIEIFVLFVDIILLIFRLLSCYLNLVKKYWFFSLFYLVFLFLDGFYIFFLYIGNIFYQTSWGSKTWRRKAWKPKSCYNFHSWWCCSNYWYESGEDMSHLVIYSFYLFQFLYFFYDISFIILHLISYLLFHCFSYKKLTYWVALLIALCILRWLGFLP